MLYDFLNALPRTSEGNLARCHGLEINASQSFIAAGQNKHSAAPASLRNLDSILPPPKPNAPGQSELFSQRTDSIQFRPLPDHFPGKLWKISSDGGNSPHDQLVPFGGNHISDGQYHRWR